MGVVLKKVQVGNCEIQAWRLEVGQTYNIDIYRRRPNPGFIFNKNVLKFTEISEQEFLVFFDEYVELIKDLLQ